MNWLASQRDPVNFSQCQVLALEGALEELPYISPSPKASETVVQSEKGGTAADTGGSAEKSDEKATGEATAATGKDGDDGATEGGLDNATTGSSSGQSNDSRVRRRPQN